MPDNNINLPENYVLRYNDQTGEPLLLPREAIDAEGKTSCSQPAEGADDNISPASVLENDAPLYSTKLNGGTALPSGYEQQNKTACAQSADSFENQPRVDQSIDTEPTSTSSACPVSPYSGGRIPSDMDGIPVPPAFAPSFSTASEGSPDLVSPERCAGFFTRLAAWLIDCAVVWIMTLAVGFILSTISSATNGSLTQTVFFTFTISDILKYLVSVAYFVLLTKLTGCTAGKRLFRICVISSDETPLSWWNVIYRETIGRYLSSILCIGYLVLAFDKKHRGFHDMLCNTLVVYSERVVFASQR
ncbi:MAG: RDD family protein [Oscillospiraceae bacterium]